MSIPIMLVAIAIAVVPLLGAMRRDEQARRAALVAAGTGSQLADASEELPVAA